MEAEIVRLTEFNRLFCKVHCDSGIAFEIYERFSFYVEGYKFMQSYKSGRWDGRIKLFDLRTRSFPVGLIPMLREFLEENGYIVEIEGNFLEPSKIYDDVMMDVWNKAKYKPRKHQFMSVMNSLRSRNRLILSPTGSGKSLIIYALVRYLMETQEGDILITVPSTQLVEQLYSDFEEYQTDGWEVELDVHRLYGGKEKEVRKRVLISTWQSIYKNPRSWFERFNVYICDEAHLADGKSISGIIENLNMCEYRIGLTGTLDGSSMHELEMMSRFGDIYRATTSKELMESGDLANLSITCLHVLHNTAPKKRTYQDEIDFLVASDARNEMLCDIAMSQEGNVLMLFNFIEKHGAALLEKLKVKCEKHGKELYYIDGSTDVVIRERIRAALEKKTNCVLLSTYGVMSTGINIKNLDVLMLCHPFKSQIRNLQSIGRVLRVSDSKSKAKLIDFGDDFQYNSGRQNKVLEHFLHRIQIYESEGFEYKVKRFEL